MNPFASLLLGLVSALGSRGAPQAQNALGAPNPQEQNTSIPGGMFGMMPWAPPNPFIPVGLWGIPQLKSNQVARYRTMSPTSLPTGRERR